MKYRAIAALFMSLPSLYGFSLGSWFAPRAELWDLWQAHAEITTKAVDHSPWDALLQRYVRRGDDGINRFDYAAVSDADRTRLDTYLEQLQAESVRALTRDQQLAFWINLYNATTVRIVLDHYPVASIRDIDLGGGLFSRGPWKAKVLEIDDQSISLNDIEHRILRPIWMDPRIHYAVNCASLGCPDLQSHAFTAENSDDLLTRAARQFVNHPRGVRVDGEALRLSSIYDWFRSDFGGSGSSVLAHLRKYAESELRQHLDEAHDIDGYTYDWSLNDAQGR